MHLEQHTRLLTPSRQNSLIVRYSMPHFNYSGPSSLTLATVCAIYKLHCIYSLCYLAASPKTATSNIKNFGSSEVPFQNAHHPDFEIFQHSFFAATSKSCNAQPNITKGALSLEDGSTSTWWVITWCTVNAVLAKSSKNPQ